MSIPIIVTGDDVLLPATLKKNGATFTIDPGAEVKARLVATDHYKVYSTTVTQAESAPGADWANSLVIVSLPSAVTTEITQQGKASLEIQVLDTYKLTWFAEVEILRGNID